MGRGRAAVFLALAVAPLWLPANQQDSLITIEAARGFAQRAAALTSPALEERKAIRRDIYRRGYAAVLHDGLAGDGLMALIDYVRMRGRVEFGMQHTPLVVYITVVQPEKRDAEKGLPGFSGAPSGPVAFQLADDWRLPEDPWKAR